jgi:spermidine/putrescine transport system ATP-binding protein
VVKEDENYQLKFENVTKIFENNFVAVDNVTFSVRKDEFLTILGPSGSGKTTILRMIAGFEFPSSGQIYLNNKLLTTVPPNKRPVNTVFQNYALFPHLNVYNNIIFGLIAKRVAKNEIKKKAYEVMELVSLVGLEKRFPAQLSGGQQQRVALARALVCRPEILLSDESLGALDLKLRRQTQIALKQVQQETNITFIHVTHDQEEAFMMSDRIIVINAGKIEQIASPLELYYNPKSLFVGSFIGENNLLKVKIAEINQNIIIGLTSKNERVIINNNEMISKGVKNGDSLLLFIRPESLNINNGFINKLLVEVKEIFLSGSEFKVLLKYSDTENIMLKIKTNAENQNQIVKGSTINIGFKPEDIVGIFFDKKI